MRIKAIFEEEISMSFGDDAAKWREQSEKLGRTVLTNVPVARYISTTGEQQICKGDWRIIAKVMLAFI